MSQLQFIEISKETIPYDFNLVIEGIVYTFVVDYNGLSDYFTFDMSSPTETLVTGDKLVLNKPLFQDIAEDDAFFVDPRYPQNTVIIPFDFSGSEERVTFENLNENIKIVIVGRSVLGIEP